MSYEFYVDVFFLTNFFLDFLAVYAVGEILRQKKKLLRYLICCAVCSLLGCVLFLFMQSYDAYLLCMHFIVNPGMTVGCFFPAGKKIYGKAFCLMYFMLLLLGGGMEWIYITVAGGRFYELCLFLTSVPVIVFLHILRRRRKNVQCFYTVWIGHQGNSVQLQALYDTGNSLYDPYVKEPVHIIDGAIFDSLGGEGEFLVRLIPFSSVGCQNGMLKAFSVEYIRIEIEGTMLEMAPAVLAAADGALFCNRPYQMILHGSVGESMERKEGNVCT